MGLVHSHQLLTQPVTLNRMRYVCQRNSKLPKELQRFNIELLANDLNKLGFNIQLRDKRGKPLSSDKICNEIYMSRPDVEGVCMVNDGKVDSTGVVELAKYFNKYYGTNIPLTVNPMDPSSPKRSVPEVCDDLYLVSDKINRRLTDDIQGVKRKLIESIDQLQMQKRILDESFARHINSLKSVGHPEFGNSFDAMKERVERSEAIRGAMMGELGRQIVYATKVADNLGAHLDSRFYPHVRHVEGVLNQYYNTPYDGSVRNVLMQTNNILSATKSLTVATTQCDDALKKLNLSLDQYDENNLAAWRDLVNEAYAEFQRHPHTQPELLEALQAHQLLLNQPGVCKDNDQKKQAFNKMREENPDLAAHFNFDDGKRVTVGGGASERAAFWVDADGGSEESHLY